MNKGHQSINFFQQDNDVALPCPRQLHTPPQTPGLNVIEPVWDNLRCEIRKHDK